MRLRIAGLMSSVLAILITNAAAFAAPLPCNLSAEDRDAIQHNESGVTNDLKSLSEADAAKLCRIRKIVFDLKHLTGDDFRARYTPDDVPVPVGRYVTRAEDKLLADWIADEIARRASQ